MRCLRSHLNFKEEWSGAPKRISTEQTARHHGSFSSAGLISKHHPRIAMLIRLIPLMAAGLSVSAPARSQEADKGTSFPTILRLTAERVCAREATADEIVVCGSRTQDRYRIPKELRSEQTSLGGPARSRLAFDAHDFAPCGIFQGERRCSKHEAAQYGYGGGRDPITFARKLLSKIADSK